MTPRDTTSRNSSARPHRRCHAPRRRSTWRPPRACCSTAASHPRSAHSRTLICVSRPHTLRSPLPAPGTEATTRAPSLMPSSSRSTHSRLRLRRPTLIWLPRRPPSRFSLASRTSARRRHRRQSSGMPSRRRRGSDRTPIYSSSSRYHHRSVVPRQRASPPHPVFAAARSSRASTSPRSSSHVPWTRHKATVRLNAA
jgi:hypothetical protein